MDDDFNFPRAVSVVFEGIRHVRRHLGAASQRWTEANAQGLESIVAELFFMWREILGMDFETAADERALGRRNPETVFTSAF